MSDSSIRNLVSNLSIEENLKNYLSSFNGKRVIFESVEYIAMNVCTRNMTVELYTIEDFDQCQMRKYIGLVELV